MGELEEVGRESGKVVEGVHGEMVVCPIVQIGESELVLGQWGLE